MTCSPNRLSERMTLKNVITYERPFWAIKPVVLKVITVVNIMIAVELILYQQTVRRTEEYSVGRGPSNSQGCGLWVCLRLSGFEYHQKEALTQETSFMFIWKVLRGSGGGRQGGRTTIKDANERCAPVSSRGSMPGGASEGLSTAPLRIVHWGWGSSGTWSPTPNPSRRITP